MVRPAGVFVCGVELRNGYNVPVTRSSNIIEFIETFCCVPEGKHVGKPLVLEPFQKRFIRDVYDNPKGTRRAILTIGRKNGKSAIVACLLLVHLVGPEAKRNSQIVSGAMSRDQAALVFGLASKMVQMNETLSENVRIIPSGKRLIGLPMNTEYKALAADGKTAHGLSPVLAILDEIGQVRGPRSEFVDSITTSQGAHDNPLLIAISTQAADDADLFSVWLDDAQKSDDPHIVCHAYTSEDGCDLMDRAAWKASNPGLGKFRSEDDLREQMIQAQRMPSMENMARNLLLNQRVSTNSPLISPDVWKSNGAEPVPFDGPVYGGLDLSSRNDLTAFVLVGQVDGIWQVKVYFWTPEKGIAERSKRDRVPYDLWAQEGLLMTTPGASVDYARVATDIDDIVAGLDLQSVAFDRWRIDVFKAVLDRLGIDLPLENWGQGFKDMGPAIDTLESELLNERMAHGMHPVLTMCAANATTARDPAGSRKLDKSRQTGRIDGMQALAMAIGVASRNTTQVPEYQLFFV